MQSDVAGMKFTNDWFALVSDRLAWRQLIEPVRVLLGPNPHWQLFNHDDDNDDASEHMKPRQPSYVTLMRVTRQELVGSMTSCSCHGYAGICLMCAQCPPG